MTTRTFAFTRRQTSLKNFAYIVFSSVTAAALFSLAYYFIYGLFFSRMLLAMAIALSIICGWIWHVIYSIMFRSVLRTDPPVFPTLILGDTRESEKLIEILTAQKNPLKPVAVLDGKGSKKEEMHGVPVLGKLNKLEEVLKKYKITHLIQCSDLEQSINLLSACRKREITYMLLPSVLGIVERDERVEKLEGQSVVCVDSTSKWNWFFR
ncbi:MAG: hypothetical protein KAS32_16910 [Candidatus Peribacteraceae bacterium]|nr:hypothetical protein [Candidatus Peribacteraceae bacterium]